MGRGREELVRAEGVAQIRPLIPGPTPITGNGEADRVEGVGARAAPRWWQSGLRGGNIKAEDLGVLADCLCEPEPPHCPPPSHGCDDIPPSSAKSLSNCD